MSPAEGVPGGDVADLTDSHVGGSGPPLVLIHGINASWRIWRPVLPALEERYTVYALTMPGHRGGPVLAPGPVSAVSLALAMAERLDALGLERPAIVGNSLGGWVALELANRGAAGAVVALSPAGAFRRPRDLKRLVRLFRMLQKMVGRPLLHKMVARPRLRRLAFRNVFAHPERVPLDEAEGMVADLEGTTLLGDFLDGVATDPEPVTAFAVAADCPVRIAWAGNDRTIPYRNYGKPMVERISGADAVIMPGVGHVPMWDDPALVVRTITDFLDRVEPGRGGARGGTDA